jgi:hypothetical protein
VKHPRRQSSVKVGTIFPIRYLHCSDTRGIEHTNSSSRGAVELKEALVQETWTVLAIAIRSFNLAAQDQKQRFKDRRENELQVILSASDFLRFVLYANNVIQIVKTFH